MSISLCKPCFGHALFTQLSIQSSRILLTVCRPARCLFETSSRRYSRSGISVLSPPMADMTPRRSSILFSSFILLRLRGCSVSFKGPYESPTSWFRDTGHTAHHRNLFLFRFPQHPRLNLFIACGTLARQIDRPISKICASPNFSFSLRKNEGHKSILRP